MSLAGTAIIRRKTPRNACPPRGGTAALAGNKMSQTLRGFIFLGTCATRQPSVKADLIDRSHPVCVSADSAKWLGA